MLKNKTCIIIFILIGIAVASAIAICIRANQPLKNKTAKIYQDGELLKEINLDIITEPIELDIIGDNGHVNTVRAEKGKIRMLRADCPDKICVNQSWIHNGIIPIVCLPNKIIIEITGAS